MSTPSTDGSTTIVNVAPAPSTSSSQSTSSPSITVHHLQDSRSQRILWLLEELAVPYTITKYMRTAGGLAPPALLKVHPLSKSPVITDSTRTIAESGVIVDYLIAHYGPTLLPSSTDEDERLAVSYWSQMAEGSLMPPLVLVRLFGAIKSNSPFFVRPVTSAIAGKVHESYIDPTLRALFTYVEQHLQQQKKAGSDFFVTSHLTSADFMMLFPLEAAGSRASDMVGEATRAYVQRMHSRPAYKRGIEKGGEYAFAKM